MTTGPNLTHSYYGFTNYMNDDGCEGGKGKTAVSKKTDTKWNSSTFCGTVLQKVEQFHNLWNSVPKMWNSSPKSGTGPEIGSLFHKLWNSSTICGTAPAKSGTGTMNSTTKVTNGMLFQDVIQCTPSYAYHMVVDRHTNYHFE